MKFLGFRHGSVDVEHDRPEPIQIALAPCCTDARSINREAKLTHTPWNSDFEILMGSKIFAYVGLDQRSVLNLHRRSNPMPERAGAHAFDSSRRPPQCPLSTSVLIGSSSAWIRSSKACTSPVASTTCNQKLFSVLSFPEEISS